MERKTILVESLGAPKRIVQQIETDPRPLRSVRSAEHGSRKTTRSSWLT